MARMLQPRSQHQCPDGKAKLNQGRVSECDPVFCADSRIPFSCIIRNALQWVQSPLARRGDFSLVAYVVRPLFPIGCCSHTVVGTATYHLADVGSVVFGNQHTIWPPC